MMGKKNDHIMIRSEKAIFKIMELKEKAGVKETCKFLDEKVKKVYKKLKSIWAKHGYPL